MSNIPFQQSLRNPIIQPSLFQISMFQLLFYFDWYNWEPTGHELIAHFDKVEIFFTYSERNLARLNKVWPYLFFELSHYCNEPSKFYFQRGSRRRGRFWRRDFRLKYESNIFVFGPRGYIRTGAAILCQ